MARSNGCRSFFRCLLKFLNLLLGLVGAAVILYALWMLNNWHHHIHPPADAPSPVSDSSTFMGLRSFEIHALQANKLAELEQFGGSFPRTFTSGFDFDPGNWKLPTPWFIYCFLGIGIAVCLITCSGYIAAETNNGCCLSCYTVLVILLVILQAAFAVDIFVNKHWDEIIPSDSTGIFDEIKHFVKENFDICKWVGLTVVVIEALSVLLALCLRAMLPKPRKMDDDSDDDDYILPRSSTRQPLLNRQGAQGTVQNASAAEARPSRSDAWSTRMREKYGLDTKEFTYDPADSKRITSQASVEEKSRCSVM